LLRRQKATRAKLAEGEPIGLAEAMSAGAHRQLGNHSRLSVSERDLYLKARRLLAAEIGYDRGIGPSQAEDWITSQLARAT
jgi:RNA polymerase-interacting CarD/CdnL/TRCF family regulator